MTFRTGVCGGYCEHIHSRWGYKSPTDWYFKFRRPNLKHRDVTVSSFSSALRLLRCGSRRTYQSQDYLSIDYPGMPDLLKWYLKKLAPEFCILLLLWSTFFQGWLKSLTACLAWWFGRYPASPATSTGGANGIMVVFSLWLFSMAMERHHELIGKNHLF